MFGALTGDWQNGVRIDRCHCGADDFEVRFWKSFLQQHLQIPSGSVSGSRVSQGSRFAKEENAIGPRRLVGAHPNRRGAARKGGREKAQAELVVLDEEIFVSNSKLFEKASWM